VVGWIPPPSTDRWTHTVHSLDSSAGASKKHLSLPFLLSWSLRLTLVPAWTLPYTLVCTAKSPSSPSAGCCRCCCCCPPRPDPFTLVLFAKLWGRGQARCSSSTTTSSASLGLARKPRPGRRAGHHNVLITYLVLILRG
jgi:hypothetical protein